MSGDLTCLRRQLINGAPQRDNRRADALTSGACFNGGARPRRDSVCQQLSQDVSQQLNGALASSVFLTGQDIHLALTPPTPSPVVPRAALR